MLNLIAVKRAAWTRRDAATRNERRDPTAHDDRTSNGTDMKLIGMLDSPYVRRVAICMKLLGLEFEHAPISVFSSFERRSMFIEPTNT